MGPERYSDLPQLRKMLEHMDDAQNFDGEWSKKENASSAKGTYICAGERPEEPEHKLPRHGRFEAGWLQATSWYPKALPVLFKLPRQFVPAGVFHIETPSKKAHSRGLVVALTEGAPPRPCIHMCAGMKKLVVENTDLQSQMTNSYQQCIALVPGCTLVGQTKLN